MRDDYVVGGERLQLERRREGWAWVAAEFSRVRDLARSEAERLLGPDRGGAA